MSQKTSYICDSEKCKKEIGDKKHISLVFAGHTNASGIAIPPKESKHNQWGVHHKLNRRFLHFCNGKCIGAFFSDLMSKK